MVKQKANLSSKTTTYKEIQQTHNRSITVQSFINLID